MAKVKCKGTIYKHTISATLTAIAQVKSIELSGAESETWKSSALDTGVYHTYEQTGYAEPGEVSMEIWFDPALVGHQFITDCMDAPADNAHSITYADTAATVQAFTTAGVAFGVAVQMDDGLAATVKYKIDGAPGWPT